MNVDKAKYMWIIVGQLPSKLDDEILPSYYPEI